MQTDNDDLFNLIMMNQSSRPTIGRENSCANERQYRSINSEYNIKPKPFFTISSRHLINIQQCLCSARHLWWKGFVSLTIPYSIYSLLKCPLKILGRCQFDLELVTSISVTVAISDQQLKPVSVAALLAAYLIGASPFPQHEAPQDGIGPRVEDILSRPGLIPDTSVLSDLPDGLLTVVIHSRHFPA